MAKAAPIHKVTRPDGILRDSVSVILLRFQEMLDFVTAARHVKNQEALHDMRIASKRLRYTIEIFAPTLPSEVIAVLKTIEEIQEQLGALHDLDVLIPVLQEIHEKETERERRLVLNKQKPLPHLAAEGLLAQIARYKAERQERFATFWLYWDALPSESLAQSLHHLVTPPAQK
jgi:CHAD domain-containing protein